MRARAPPENLPDTCTEGVCIDTVTCCLRVIKALHRVSTNLRNLCGSFRHASGRLCPDIADKWQACMSKPCMHLVGCCSRTRACYAAQCCLNTCSSARLARGQHSVRTSAALRDALQDGHVCAHTDTAAAKEHTHGAKSVPPLQPWSINSVTIFHEQWTQALQTFYDITPAPAAGGTLLAHSHTAVVAWHGDQAQSLPTHTPTSAQSQAQPRASTSLLTDKLFAGAGADAGAASAWPPTCQPPSGVPAQGSSSASKPGTYTTLVTPKTVAGWPLLQGLVALIMHTDSALATPAHTRCPQQLCIPTM